MSRFDIDAMFGPMRIRAWLLVVNFVFNAIGLYGLSRFMVTEQGWLALVFGLIGTIVCISLLTQPSER